MKNSLLALLPVLLLVQVSWAQRFYSVFWTEPETGKILLTNTKAEATVWAEPDYGAPVIAQLKHGQEIQLYGFKNSFWKIKAGATTGYVQAYMVSPSPTAEAKRLEAYDKHKKAYYNQPPNWGNSIYGTVYSTKYKPGEEPILRKAPDKNSAVLAHLKPGEKVRLIGYEPAQITSGSYSSGFWKVVKNGKTGYVQYYYLDVPEEAEELRNQTEDQEAARIRKAEERLQAEKKAMVIQEFGKTDGERIWRKEVWIGMTEKQALASKGKPAKITSPEGAKTSITKWDYKGKGFNFDYLYFSKGKLTRIEVVPVRAIRP